MKPHPIRAFLPQRGLTLVELMTALAVSLILLAGVGQVYVSSKRSYALQEEMARLQENARFAMHFLTEEIRQAGYAGCANMDELTRTGNAKHTLDPAKLGKGSYEEVLDDFRYRMTVAVEGFEADGTAPGEAYSIASFDPSGVAVSSWDGVVDASTGSNFDLDASLADLVVPGTDVVVVRRAHGEGIHLTETQTADAEFKAELKSEVAEGCPGGTDKVNGVCINDVLMLTDCKAAVMFEVTNNNVAGGEHHVVHSNGGIVGNVNPAPQWLEDINLNPGDAEILRMGSFVFFIGEGANGQPSLFRMELVNGVAPEELVEGVENMQVLYGIDTDEPFDTRDYVADRYVTADQITTDPDSLFSTRRVVSVQVSLLVRTGRDLPGRPTDTKTYILSGTDADSGTSLTLADALQDERLRRVFTSVVHLRNRGT